MAAPIHWNVADTRWEGVNEDRETQFRLGNFLREYQARLQEWLEEDYFRLGRDLRLTIEDVVIRPYATNPSIRRNPQLRELYHGYVEVGYEFVVWERTGPRGSRTVLARRPAGWATQRAQLASSVGTMQGGSRPHDIIVVKTDLRKALAKEGIFPKGLENLSDYCPKCQGAVSAA